MEDGMTTQTGEFRARNEDGQEYVIEVHTNWIDAGTMKDPNAKIPAALKELWTSTGERVNRIEKGTYEIVSSGLILTSTDPNAL